MSKAVQIVGILAVAFVVVFVVIYKCDCARCEYTGPTIAVPSESGIAEAGMGIFAGTSAYLANQGQMIRFIDGVATYEFAPDSASRGVIRVVPGTVFEADGYIVSVISATEGGTGTFYHLVALKEENGVFIQDDSVYLGDRIEVVSAVANSAGQLELTTKERLPSQPMSEEPAIELTTVYELAAGKLSVSPQ